METDQEDNSTTSKKKKLEVEGELVKVIKTQGRKIQMKVKGPTFQVNKYDFLETPKGSIDQFKTRD